MDFARKQLEKYGWTDGKGLGKQENGIAKPLQPKLKRSVTGLGHDVAAELNDHWWSTLYDEAASNVEVKDKTKITTKDPRAFSIGSSSWSIKKTHRTTDGFVKTAILTSGGTKTERLDVEVEEDVKINVVTDEELFAACGGRTAHKGARHGLRAKGKLARIEEQEKLLLSLSKYKGYSQAKVDKKTNESSDIEGEGKRKKNKKLIEEKKLACDDEFNIEMPIPKVKKKSKNVKESANIDYNGAEESIDNVKSKKKRKHGLNLETLIDDSDNVVVPKATTDPNMGVVQDNCNIPKKKKKKRKFSDTFEKEYSEKCNDEFIEHSKLERKLKKNKIKKVTQSEENYEGTELLENVEFNTKK